MSMRDEHADGIHDGEMYKYEAYCLDCSRMVEMALDSYEAYLEQRRE